MRIVILSFFSNLVQRGAEVYAHQLSSHLPANFSVRIIGANDLSSKVTPYTGKESYLLRRTYLDKTSLRIKRATKQILKLLKKNPPDVLYPLNNGWQSLLCKRFCQRYPTKLLLAGHSGPGWDDKVNLLIKPDTFLVFSRAQRHWAHQRSRGVNLVTIPHGVDLAVFTPLKIGIPLKLERPIFVSVSALSGQGRAGETIKNLDLTVKAVANLKKGSLLIIGQGTNQAKIDQMAKSTLGPDRYKRITVSHNVINQYYRSADVFTLASSTSEAFGIVYLEALASNLPVVTTDDKLRREIIGPAGVFIKNPHDIKSYSRGLAKAFSTNWGDQPRHQAEKFSWQNSAKKYQQLFNNLVKSVNYKSAL